MPTVKKSWNGGALSNDVKAAISRAGRRWGADCVAQVQQPGWWPRDTGESANNMTFGQDDPTSFWFGNVTDDYVLWVEINHEANHPNGRSGAMRATSDRITPHFGDYLDEELKR